MRDSKTDTDIKNRLSDTVGEGKGGMIWEKSVKHVYYHMWNRSSVQVRYMKQGTQSQGSGTTWGIGEGGGSGVQDGGHMNTMADSCQCMAKTTTIL